MIQDNLKSYKPAARFLHWTVALLVLTTVPAGLIMVREGLDRGVQDTLFIYHKNVGVIILILMICRLVYRTLNPPPPLPPSVPDWQQRIAGLTHAGLYLVVFVMAISGYLRVRAGGFPIEGLDALGVPPLLAKSKGLEDSAKYVHFLAHYAVIALVAMHIGAALFHAIVKRDGVMSRMWPGSGR